MSSVLRAIVIAILAVASIPAPARAQSIRQDCLTHVAPISRLSFAHDKHRLWYQRFWNGKCQGLSTSLFGDACSESEPGWNLAVGDLMRQAPAQRAPELLAKVCRLGELVGYEWAKDNNVRCIHTVGSSSLSALHVILKGSGDLSDRLTRAEAKAKSMCASLHPPAHR